VSSKSAAGGLLVETRGRQRRLVDGGPAREQAPADLELREQAADGVDRVAEEVAHDAQEIS
jgi:hypothetical protein